MIEDVWHKQRRDANYLSAAFAIEAYLKARLSSIESAYRTLV